MEFHITAEDADVLGSHYRLLISFQGSSVVLSPEQEEGKSFHEESVMIKSLRAHMGLSPLYDYSFMNTTLTDTTLISIPNTRNDSYKAGAFVKNHRMSVYTREHPMWGSPPTKGEGKVIITLAD